jgi:hypothetical protein
MKVGCMEEKETFEIPEKDKTIEKAVVAIICPVCKQKAYMAEIDVYPCRDCGRVWCVD